MNRALVKAACMALVLTGWGVAEAQIRTFNVNYTSRATFKTEAPLETIVGTTGGQGAVTGSVRLDPARPQDAKGTIRVDLNAVKTGIDRRDAQMRSNTFLDSETSEANRWAGAKYGEFRVDPSGRALLVGLRGAELAPL